MPTLALLKPWVMCGLVLDQRHGLQVLGVHACLDVASVVNLLRTITGHQEVRQPVSEPYDARAVVATDLDLAVPRCVASALPNPASIWVHVLGKSLGERSL